MSAISVIFRRKVCVCNRSCSVRWVFEVKEMSIIMLERASRNSLKADRNSFLPFSVTRFGEILPFGWNVKSLWLFFGGTGGYSVFGKTLTIPENFFYAIGQIHIAVNGQIYCLTVLSH